MIVQLLISAAHSAEEEAYYPAREPRVDNAEWRVKSSGCQAQTPKYALQPQHLTVGLANSPGSVTCLANTRMGDPQQ
jgi:hypothetical protein